MDLSAALCVRRLWVTLGVSLVLGALGERPARGEVEAAPAPDTSAGASTDPVPAELFAAEGEGDSGAAKPAEGAPDVDQEAKQASEEAVQPDAEAAKVDERAAQADEEIQRRRASALAFARRRVRQIAERERAKARAEARAEAKRAAAPPAVAPPLVVPPPPRELPTIVDHRSALERQLAAGWGWGADKDRQVRVPLPDWQNWRRVRLFGIDHLAAFTYTKQHHTLTAVFAVETRAKKPSSLSCMDEFERRGMPEIRRHGVHIEPVAQSASRWDERPVLVHKTEGRVSFLFSRYEFSAAWTAYPAYDHGCLVYATVVLWDGQPELARKLLDRFVVEGVNQVRPLTPELPARQPDDPAAGQPRPS